MALHSAVRGHARGPAFSSAVRRNGVGGILAKARGKTGLLSQQIVELPLQPLPAAAHHPQFKTIPVHLPAAPIEGSMVPRGQSLMASVFLSYDHEDSARAAPLAAALEAHGHSVWWDRHIHGGAEYNSAIETAVEGSDAVIVLWSEKSVRSAWVRDEAAEGRDRGCLIPVLIDAVKPPMGFRQYQTI